MSSFFFPVTLYTANSQSQIDANWVNSLPINGPHYGAVTVLVSNQGSAQAGMYVWTDSWKFALPYKEVVIAVGQGGQLIVMAGITAEEELAAEIIYKNGVQHGGVITPGPQNVWAARMPAQSNGGEPPVDDSVKSINGEFPDETGNIVINVDGREIMIYRGASADQQYAILGWRYVGEPESATREIIPLEELKGEGIDPGILDGYMNKNEYSAATEPQRFRQILQTPMPIGNGDPLEGSITFAPTSTFLYGLVAGDVTLNLQYFNLPDVLYELTLELEVDGNDAVTWGSMFKWAGGAAPELLAGVHHINLKTRDQGATIYARLVASF